MSKHDTQFTIDRALTDAVDSPPLAQPSLQVAPAAHGALVPLDAPPEAGVTVDPTPSATPYIDAHGFDPADYTWVPVRRRPRSDGFGEAKQRRFIAALADTGCVEQAARAVEMSVQSCYRLRRSPGAEPFAAAWDAAIQQAALKLADMAFARAIHGSEELVFDGAGNRVGRRLKPNDRLLMFLLRAHLPDRYRHAHQGQVQPGEVPPRALPPVAQAITQLSPQTPADPHLLMPPEQLDVEIEVADMRNGTLPRWYDEDPAPSPAQEAGALADLERLIEGAKQPLGSPAEKKAAAARRKRHHRRRRR